MTILYFILAALALGILVFFHELGHYLMAKKLGMKVEVFSIGFGKPFFKWRVGDVDWQLCVLPFGGYVRIAGMELTKKDKNTYIEPHEVPNGFFSKPPYQRILVALAGPTANFILAFVIFTALWAMGGRSKPFSEFTHIIGWVDPKSEIYAQGARPGDVLKSYDGKPYTNSKDLLYAAMLGDKKVQLSGEHVDYTTGERRPFNYRIETYPAVNSLDGIMTTGITKGASFLVYNKIPDGSTSIVAGSPMDSSGIQYGDRLVWADGEVLFSLEQLSAILNKGEAYLTVKRGSEVFQTRQPRVKAGDLILPSAMRNELVDWQYEAGIKGRPQDLYMIPYHLSADAVVIAPLSFIDEESKKEAFPLHPYSQTMERSLRAGDQILSIDGTEIQTAYQLLDLVQTHHVLLIVDSAPLPKTMSWTDQDAIFQKSIHVQDINKISSTIGLEGAVREAGSYRLLRPVEPKKISEFISTADQHAQMESQKSQVAAIKDPEKRAKAAQYLEEVSNRYVLGVNLQDEQVIYNPTPFAQFKIIFIETVQTLKSLFSGYLNPKWISGPIGIVQVLHHGWKLGIGEALFWIGVISLNLGVLNLLPLPVLDGGYVVLSLWEMITRKKIKAKVLERLILPFVILLIGLLIFLTFQDIFRLF